MERKNQMNDKSWKNQHPALIALVIYAHLGLLIAGIAVFLKLEISGAFQVIYGTGISALGGFTSINHFHKKKYGNKSE